MNAYKTALTSLCLATSLLAANAMADTASTQKDDKGVHAEIRDGANETPATNKGKGTGLLGGGPVKENPEDVKPGKSEKMNDTQGETARFKDKNKDAAQ